MPVKKKAAFILEEKVGLGEQSRGRLVLALIESPTSNLDGAVYRLMAWSYAAVAMVELEDSMRIWMMERIMLPS